MQGCPAITPMGWVAVMVLPFRSAFCVNWAIWPLLSVKVYGVFAAPAARPFPPAMATTGLMVTLVASWLAMMFIDGPAMS